MAVKLISQRPYAQCHICYRANVDKVCHHCGRAICDKATCKSMLLPGEATFPNFPNQEFAQLALDDVRMPVVAIHCRQCADRWHGRNLFWRVVQWLRGHNHPDLPLVPTLNGVSITETLTAPLSLDAQGKYTAPSIKAGNGELKIALQFNERDRGRKAAYHKRYGHRDDPNLAFHAGFAVLEGTSRVNAEFLHMQSNQLIDTTQLPPANHPPGVQLRQGVDTLVLRDKVSRQAFLTDPQSRTNGWEATFQYTFTGAEGKSVPLPIQLIPVLVPDNTQRTLELVVQLRPDVEFEAARIDEMVVWAPLAAGQVLKTQPEVRLNPAPQHLDKEPRPHVTWQGLNIETAKDQPRRRSFLLHFQNPLEPTMQVRGKLQVTFKGTLSGLKDVKFFYPWGEKRITPAVKRQTQVNLEFALSLNQLRFQTLYAEQTKSTLLNFADIVLDHDALMALTQRLNEAGMYVRRVIENPMRVSKLDGYTTNQLWDLTGRYYIGIYPIDFHIMLTDTEINTRRGQHEVKARITVQGFVTNPAMGTAIEQFREHLLQQINQTFAQLAAQAKAQPERPGFPTR